MDEKWRDHIVQTNRILGSLLGFDVIENYDKINKKILPVIKDKIVATNIQTQTKYSFTSDGNATDVGDLTTTSMGGNASSSTAHGYHSGGRDTPSSQTNILQKWSFSADANATDVGDLLLNVSYATGNQN